ncbi:hypothetical protein DV515_00010356 [Chloebia gouldiae]|uniref:Uncharacterized protein n=1 Tax=Chloebia gouldiae TaxID=44316 RepID=A0A3L8SAB7_CHLGU|nr:hypothetical protein DV515_00010356 [Chloebia gouldiae]
MVLLTQLPNLEELPAWALAHAALREMLLGNGFRKTLSFTPYGEAEAISMAMGLPQPGSTQQVRMDDLPAHGTGAQGMEEDGQTGGRHTCGEVAAAGSCLLAAERLSLWLTYKTTSGTCIKRT